MTTEYLEVEQYMGGLLTRLGFIRDGGDSNLIYGERPAWAVYYRSADCRLQVCWSAREGGIDFMLAPLEAPKEFGLSNHSTKWRFLLMLSDFDEGLATPRPDASTDVWWEWRKALFEAHFPVARNALLHEG